MVRWYAKEGKLPDAPKQVQVILSDLCQQDCSFCAYRMSGYTSNELFVGNSPLAKYGHSNPVRFMPPDRALRLMDELKEAGVLAVQFTGGGEPTLGPNHEAVFRRALELGLSAALVSNGIRWSDVLRGDILPAFAWVRMSLDAGTPETYASIRRCSPNHWDIALRNATSLAGHIQTQRSPCLLGIGWVVTPENYREIVEGVRVASETGARYVRMSAMFNPNGELPYAEIWQEIKESIREAKRRYEGPGFTVHDLFGERLEDLRDGSPDYKTCSYQHYTHFIGGDLKAYRCCVTSYSDHGQIAGGDYSKMSFEEFWNSDARKQDMENFEATSCVRCQFSDKNRQMQYLLNIKPKHVEFT